MCSPLYDYVIVGAGLFGAVFAREMTDVGKHCLVIEQRTHVAGNCYTEAVEGIQVHAYGPHIFHTDSRRIWEYAQRFAEFNSFTYRPRVLHRGRLYSFPINLLTLHQLWGVTSPAEAKAMLDSVRVHNADASNLEGWLLSRIGRELYETFYEGYTTKQWGRSPAELPAAIAARVPIRIDFEDNYFSDQYQGIPIGGYTRLVSRVLCGIEVWLNTNFFGDVAYFRQIGRKLVFSGPIDRFYNYCYGALEYRSLRFEREILPIADFQGTAAVNYTDMETPYTRIVEHKHFDSAVKSDQTVITREYPVPAGQSATIEPFYPLNDAVNNALYARYRELADADASVLFGGRLATYKYYDMHQVIGQALAMAQREARAAGRKWDHGSGGLYQEL